MLKDTGSLGEFRLNHIGLAVKDAEATSKFLSSMWGIDPWQIFDYPSPKEQMVFGEPFVLKVAFAKFGPTTLELLEPVKSPRSIWAQHITKNGEGIHHVALSLKNFDEKIEELKAQGSKMLIHARAPAGEFEGKQWCYMETKPGGLIVELMDDFGL